MHSLESILRESAKRHKYLCPRQVLGARMSLMAGEILGLELPRVDKRLLVIAETDGCTVDGIIAATISFGIVVVLEETKKRYTD